MTSLLLLSPPTWSTAFLKQPLQICIALLLPCMQKTTSPALIVISCRRRKGRRNVLRVWVGSRKYAQSPAGICTSSGFNLIKEWLKFFPRAMATCTLSHPWQERAQRRSFNTGNGHLLFPSTVEVLLDVSFSLLLDRWRWTHHTVKRDGGAYINVNFLLRIEKRNQSSMSGVAD